MQRGFALIELLIVVAIIAILAAIAVPNFLEAQTRSRVARVKSDQGTLATTLESCGVDWNQFPFEGDITGANNPCARPGIGVVCPDAAYSLKPLTTPVAYITSIPNDPFMVNVKGVQGSGSGPVGPLFELDSYFCANYTGPEKRFGITGQFNDARGWGLTSFGPDKQNNNLIMLPMYLNLANGTFRFGMPISGQSTADWVYDPTNGTIGLGDIGRFGGPLPGDIARAMP
jgi:prepilin-type N-terminal cleavage/methylation domain-containing protein